VDTHGSRALYFLWGARTLLIITTISIILVHVIFYSYYPGAMPSHSVIELSWNQTLLGYSVIITGFTLTISSISWFFPVIGFILAFIYCVVSILSRYFIGSSGVYVNISIGQLISLFIAFLIAIIIYAIAKKNYRRVTGYLHQAETKVR
jgi:hypothetical protein